MFNTAKPKVERAEALVWGDHDEGRNSSSEYICSGNDLIWLVDKLPTHNADWKSDSSGIGDFPSRIVEFEVQIADGRSYQISFEVIVLEGGWICLTWTSLASRAIQRNKP